jgi:hypothetical protein
LKATGFKPVPLNINPGFKSVPFKFNLRHYIKPIYPTKLKELLMTPRIQDDGVGGDKADEVDGDREVTSFGARGRGASEVR